MQSLWAALQAAPYKHDFYATLRRLEALHPGLPRLGRALRPRDEPVRIGQDPELEFAPAAIMSFQVQEGRPPRIGQRFFGLWGPMGPMPLHLTDYARDRARNHADPGVARFADLFHHRAALLFYRAWAQAQPVTHLDRPGDDDFSRWVSSLFGQGPAEFRQRDSIPDHAKRLHAAALARGPRNAEGLTKILRQHFGVPVRLEPHMGQWLDLRPEDRTRLLPPTAPNRRNALGVHAVAGGRVWDRQSSFRLHLGPLSYAQYERFLPGQPALVELRDWLRQYVGFSLTCETRLVLRGAEVPALRMGPRDGQRGRLGWTTWLGRRGPHPDRGDRKVRPEACLSLSRPEPTMPLTPALSR
ncbi:MAG TPA: type VI secretion system baseplate subunit TssG [Burkholderiaceae bacterium]|nr:type VI secretion system baseplate subunit TssG [Burkholderiaceae bacterium]